jgi:hypothetical protein
MMAAKRIAASCLLVLMLAGMRDPFKPPPDRCMVSQLALWHYQGVVSRLRPRQGLCAIPPGDGDACRRKRLREAGAWWNLIKKRCASRQGKVVNPRTGAGNEKDLSMKRTAVVALCLSSLAASAATPAPVTLMVDDVPVTQVLQALAGQEKHNLVISPDVSGTLSLHLVDVPWKQALNTVIASAGLTLRREGNILYVHSASWQQQQYDAREAALEKQKQSLPLEERSLTLRYAQASELAKAGEKLLGPKGTITVDNRLNRLLLRDHKASLNVLEKWVAQMDLPVEQVELAAHIVTINERVCVNSA